jgi:hypothetical protein
MKNFSESLAAELETQLKSIHSQSADPVIFSEQAVNALVVILEKLKTFVLKHKFRDKLEEITFFRDTKPQFASKLIYYNEVYNIATNKPFGSKKVLKKYYRTELRKLETFFEENADFYKYCRTGNRSLDNQYFIRGKQNIRLTLDSFYLQADNRFSTSHDYKRARLLANDEIKHYIELELAALDGINASQQASENKMKWTGSKVALVELAYALHAESVLDNGRADLKETMAYFEKMFDIDLGQFHRAFLEIRGRKSDRTKFLSSLTNTLVARMDDADEN